jgi:hypothetical protein
MEGLFNLEPTLMSTASTPDPRDFLIVDACSCGSANGCGAGGSCDCGSENGGGDGCPKVKVA